MVLNYQDGAAVGDCDSGSSTFAAGADAVPGSAIGVLLRSSTGGGIECHEGTGNGLGDRTADASNVSCCLAIVEAKQGEFKVSGCTIAIPMSLSSQSTNSSSS